jgi:DNA helicase IV
LTIIEATADSLPGDLARVCSSAVRGPGSVAVIVADEQVTAVSAMMRRAGLRHHVLAAAASEGGLALVPVTLAKGLEFDDVIVVEPARIAAAESRGLHRLYVALTRAVSRLTVLHAEPLPELLR